MVKVAFENKELLESGVFILSRGLSPTIHLGSGAEALKIILGFVTEQGEKPLVRSEPVDNKTLRLVFVNWDNVLGTGLVEPIEIGTFAHRKLSVNFVVRKVGTEGDTREITFSAYLGEEVPRGSN